MSRTLQDLKAHADQAAADGKLVDALKVFRLVLEAAPLDFDLRLDIADVVAALGAKDVVKEVLKSLFDHDVKAGSPLRAMASLKRLEALGVETRDHVAALAESYAFGSRKLGRSVRLAPTDYSSAVRDDIVLDYPIAVEQLVLDTARMTAYTGNIQNYPPIVPPVQIFSTLEPVPFAELLGRLTLSRYAVGEAIVQQGEVGDAIYFIARGEVVVTRAAQGQGGEERVVKLARLGPGTLFGEMALVSAEPRTATVVCDTRVDALKLARRDVEDLAGRLPQVAGAMARFTRERLISNLLATHPLFQPFEEDSRKQLLGRFTGHDVPAGAVFLEQGEPGPGLYVVLQGQAEVLRTEGDETIKLADIGPGDTVGEIGLLFEEAATATVRTTAPSTLLFLARELFKPLIDAVPDLLAHFNKLAEDRLADTEFKMMQTRVIDDDFIEELEEDVELDEEDVVLI